MKNIVVIGSSNTDMVVKTSHLPAGGETVLGGDFFMNAGGKGANQAVAAARYGNRVVFVAKTGDDLFGRQVRKSMAEDGIVTDYVFVDKEHPSGVALITIDKDAENCIVVAGGANMYLSPADIDTAAEEILKADVVLMQLESPIETVAYAARMAAKAGIPVILNPAPAPAEALSEALLKDLFLITPNRSEASRISGIEVTDMESAHRAAKAIHEMGPKNVIITLGSDGSLVYDGSMFMRVEALKVEAVDTTAAGDTYNGVLASVIAEGKSLIEAVREANIAGAISVTRMGAQPAAPTREEIAAMKQRK
ncbi:MAG: ribokinase [Alistipes sp.]|nr:ribokinase [Alistipes sp.]MBQ3212369.1 ribokinase [Alistipes sp.]MBQ7787588.1 ribokinase [Alistipes sp.]MBR3911427.1 ribokinase [Alistipes sp.]